MQILWNIKKQLVNKKLQLWKNLVKYILNYAKIVKTMRYELQLLDIKIWEIKCTLHIKNCYVLAVHLHDIGVLVAWKS